MIQTNEMLRTLALIDASRGLNAPSAPAASLP